MQKKAHIQCANFIEWVPYDVATDICYFRAAIAQTKWISLLLS